MTFERLRRLLGSPLIHPLLVGAFPVLSLFAHNMNEVTWPMLVRPLAVYLGVALLSALLAGRILRHLPRGALAASLLMILTSSYGHLYRIFKRGLEEAATGAIVTALLAGWCLLLVLGIVLIARMRSVPGKLTLGLNITAAVLAAMPLGQALAFTWREGPPPAQVSLPRPARKPERKPDIYYIILDAYARRDVLADLYRFDNGDFLDFLSQRGFYIAEASRTNYAQTYFSLAASLNMKHLDDLVAKEGSRSRNRKPLRHMIINNALVSFLKREGYSVATLTSGWLGTEGMKADVSFKPILSLNDFEHLLLECTPLSAILRWIPAISPLGIYRRRVLHALDTLPRAAEGRRPAFVFAHIKAPHPPFVFGGKNESRDAGPLLRLGLGRKRSQARQIQARYLDQLKYINERLKTVIDAILASSPTPPVIVVQADHGPRFAPVGAAERRIERTAILNAVLLPEGKDRLYRELTPVNTFRIVLATYFGMDLPPLKDKVLFSTYGKPYALRDVTKQTLPRRAVATTPAVPPGSGPKGSGLTR